MDTHGVSEPVPVEPPQEGEWLVLRNANLPGHRPLGLFKPESRLSGAWYTLDYCTLLSLAYTGTA